MKNILITGGAGYIGSTLIKILDEAGYNITVYDNLSFGGDALISFISKPNFTFIQGDVRDFKLLESHVKKADVIIHLAAIVGFPACRQNPTLAEDVNVNGAINIIKASSKNQLIIGASTGSNYGDLFNEVCTEDTPLKPLSLYGETKTKAEELKKNFSDLEIVDWGETPEFNMIINATSLGLNKDDEIKLDYTGVGTNKLFFDVIYNPKKTKFLSNYDLSSIQTVSDITSSDIPDIIRDGVSCDICHTMVDKSPSVHTQDHIAAVAQYHINPGEHIKYGSIQLPDTNSFHRSVYLPLFNLSSYFLILIHKIVIVN